MDNFKSTRMFIKMWQPQSNPHSNISYYCNELLTQFSLQTPYEAQSSNLTQSFIRRTSAPLRQTDVTGWCSVVRPCKPLSIVRFTVLVVSVCAVAYFLFSEGREGFFNSILSGWDRHTLCQALVCALAGAAWQCVWLLGWLFIVFYNCPPTPLNFSTNDTNF